MCRIAKGEQSEAAEGENSPWDGGGERRCPGRKEPCAQALTGWEQKQRGMVPSSFTLDEHLLRARRQTAKARCSSCSGAAGTNLSAVSELSPGCALPHLWSRAMGTLTAQGPWGRGLLPGVLCAEQGLAWPG